MLKTQLDYALKAKGFGNMSKFAKLTGIRRSTIDDWVKKIELLKKFVKWGYGAYYRLPGGGRKLVDPQLEAHLLKFVAGNVSAGSTTSVADLMIEASDFIDKGLKRRIDDTLRVSHGFVRGYHTYESYFFAPVSHSNG